MGFIKNITSVANVEYGYHFLLNQTSTSLQYYKVEVLSIYAGIAVMFCTMDSFYLSIVLDSVKTLV